MTHSMPTPDEIRMVLERMGYKFVKEDGGFQSYEYQEVANPLILDTKLFNRHIPAEMFDQLLEINGINPDVFHSFWESV